jgi:hypothetical protein
MGLLLRLFLLRRRKSLISWQHGAWQGKVTASSLFISWLLQPLCQDATV